MTHYETLGVSPTATDAELKAAYRQAIRRAHPDAGGSDERAALINAAYDTIGNEPSRHAYNRELFETAARASEPVGDGYENAEPVWYKSIWDEVPAEAPAWDETPAPPRPRTAPGPGFDPRALRIAGWTLALSSLVLAAAAIYIVNVASAVPSTTSGWRWGLYSLAIAAVCSVLLGQRWWAAAVVLAVPTVSPLAALAGFGPSISAMESVGWPVVVATALMAPAAISMRLTASRISALWRARPARKR